MITNRNSKLIYMQYPTVDLQIVALSSLFDVFCSSANLQKEYEIEMHYQTKEFCYFSDTGFLIAIILKEDQNY